jgi:hypothetical protein
MHCYTRVKRSQINLNVGVAFFILLFLNLNVYAKVISVSGSVSVEYSYYYATCSIGYDEQGLTIVGAAGGSASVPLGIPTSVYQGVVSVSVDATSTRALEISYYEGDYSPSSVYCPDKTLRTYTSLSVCSCSRQLSGVSSAGCNVGSVCSDNDDDFSVCSVLGSTFLSSTASINCSFQIEVTDDFVPPPTSSPCSTPHPVNDSRCKGGQGLAFQANEPVGVGQIVGMFGVDNDIVRAIWTPINPQPEGDNLLFPDGSQCSLFNEGYGIIYDWLVCSLGFSEEPSSSSAAETPSSSSGYDPCNEFPDLPGCSGNGGTGSSGSGNGDGDGDCPRLSNCDWAKLDVQLTQLGVETEIRNLVSGIAELSQMGYNLSREQVSLLEGVINAVNANSSAITGAIGNSTGSITSAITNMANNLGSKIEGSTSAVNGVGNKIDSLRNGLADGVAGGLGKFAGDTSGAGSFNDLLNSFGHGSGSAMGDSLGNGLGMRNKIKQAIPIDSASFAFFGNSSSCPVWDLSFNAGIVSCNSCKIDLCNVYGFNAGQLIRSIIWLFALLGVLFMNLNVLKTGGH